MNGTKRLRAYIYGENAMKSTVLDLENPMRVINALAAGPMTKWELKHRTKLEYSRVHEAVSLLERDGRVKVYDIVVSKKGREQKVYGLTFKGVIAHLASTVLKPPEQIVPLKSGQTIEDIKQRFESEREAYQKQLEQIAAFLERYGKILNYELFREVRWLMERWRFAIKDIVEIAKFIEFFRPTPKGFMKLHEDIRNQLVKLKRERWEMLRNPDKPEPIVFKIQHEGIVEEERFDPLKDIEEDIKDLEKRLETIIQEEEHLWRRSFTARFAERYQYYKPIEGKDMHNEALQELFKQTAEEIKRLEVEPLEKMADLFKGPAT